MEIDFYTDLIRIARRELGVWGVETLFLTDDELVTRYFVLQHRVMERGPYKVHVSTKAEDFFVGVSSEIRRGICKLLKRAQKFDVLWPHQSRRLLARASPRRVSRAWDAQHDGLLNDWGIQHLHLGTRTSADRFVERTSTLAFIMARKPDLYIIDFRKHPTGDWSDKDLLETVEKHWPALNPELVGVSALPPRDGVTHQAMRNAGMTVVLERSTGRIIAPPGWGYSVSGHSALAIRQRDRVTNGLRRMEAHLLSIENALQSACGGGPCDLHLELDSQGRFQVFSKGTQLMDPKGERLPAAFGL